MKYIHIACISSNIFFLFLNTINWKISNSYNQLLNRTAPFIPFQSRGPIKWRPFSSSSGLSNPPLLWVCLPLLWVVTAPGFSLILVEMVYLPTPYTVATQKGNPVTRDSVFTPLSPLHNLMIVCPQKFVFLNNYLVRL